MIKVLKKIKSFIGDKNGADENRFILLRLVLDIFQKDDKMIASMDECLSAEEWKG